MNNSINNSNININTNNNNGNGNNGKNKVIAPNSAFRESNQESQIVSQVLDIKQKKTESIDDYQIRKQKQLSENINKIWKEIDEVIVENIKNNKREEWKNGCHHPFTPSHANYCTGTTSTLRHCCAMVWRTLLDTNVGISK